FRREVAVELGHGRVHVTAGFAFTTVDELEFAGYVAGIEVDSSFLQSGLDYFPVAQVELVRRGVSVLLQCSAVDVGQDAALCDVETGSGNGRRLPARWLVHPRPPLRAPSENCSEKRESRRDSMRMRCFHDRLLTSGRLPLDRGLQRISADQLQGSGSTPQD